MSFPRDARIVQFATPPRERESRLCVVVPAWTYRVTAPVLPRRGIDLFEKVVLGLCQAGLREPEQIGAKINLHPRLCRHIIQEATRRRLLDAHGELTAQGRQALRTGSVAEEATWSVRYVFQSPVNGDLWPRTVEQLTDTAVLERRGGRVKLRFGTHGRPDDAFATVFAADVTPPPRPGAAQIVEAARLDRVARERARVQEFERRSGLAPAPQPEPVRARTAPDGSGPPELARVTFVDGPEAVLMVAFVEAGPRGALVARDPFGAGDSTMLKELLEKRAGADQEFAELVNGLAREKSDEVKRSFKKSDRDVDAQLENELTVEFGHRIRTAGNVLPMMVGLEKAVLVGDLEKVAQDAYRLFEVLFRELAGAFPPPKRLIPDSVRLSRAVIEGAALRLGFQTVPVLFQQSLSANASKLNNGKDLYLKEALPLACVAANDNRPDHPLHSLAQKRPDLLSALVVLGELRNRGAHGDRDPSSAEDAGWCRELAVLAVRTLLLLP